VGKLKPVILDIVVGRSPAEISFAAMSLRHSSDISSICFPYGFRNACIWRSQAF
jgi:hypothetical protein